MYYMIDMSIFSGKVFFSSDIKRIILITVCSAGMIFYIFLTPPAADIAVFGKIPLISSLPYDFSAYAGRFLFSFLFLGLLPFTAALFLRYKPSDIGLCLSRVKNPAVLYSVLAASAIILGILSSFDKTVSEYYPYSHYFPELACKYGFAVVLIHPLIYLIFFYIPWEIMFRGILIFPFLEKEKIYAVACLQAIPSALLHFGHPFSELVSAVIFGLSAGIITVRTKSIIPALLFHALLGITLDLTLIIKVI